MKVYAEYDKIQSFLIDNPVDGIQIVTDKHSCNFMVSGQYKDDDYNPDLRGVIIPYTGHNGIDLDAMRKHNLMLFVTPTRSRYVAEKAITLTLSLMGNVVSYHNLLKKGNWAARNSTHRVPWESIQDKNIGLLGYGRIGTRIHKMMLGFNCDFYTINRFKEYPQDVNTVNDLNALINVSDVVIISIPLNEETKHLIDADILEQMHNKFLINVGRGNIVKQDDLFQALKSKKLRGYASDVWYNYPQGKEIKHPSDYPIYELDNVVLSNHSGGFTTTTNKEVNRDLLNKLKKLQNKNYEEALDVDNLI